MDCGTTTIHTFDFEFAQGIERNEEFHVVMKRTLRIEVRTIGKSEIGARVREGRGSTGEGRDTSITIVKLDDGNRGLKVTGYSYNVSGKGKSATGQPLQNHEHEGRAR